MKLSEYDQKLADFVTSLNDQVLAEHSASEITAIGLHIDPVNGFIAAGVHTGNGMIGSEMNIPDFTSPEIDVIEFPAWGESYWDGDGCVQLCDGSPVVSSEDGDDEYVEVFVEWASTHFHRHTSDPGWSFKHAHHCVHPVGSDPLVYWAPEQEPTRG